MRAKTLNKSEMKEMNSRIRDSLGIEPLSKKDTAILCEGEAEYLKVNGNIDYFMAEGRVVPTLKSLLRNNFPPKVAVDMGAVKFVASGADIMRPGIVEIGDDFRKGAVVSVIDINNRKPLAVGIALIDASEMKSASGGKCIQNVHYVGDKIWQIE